MCILNRMHLSEKHVPYSNELLETVSIRKKYRIDDFRDAPLNRPMERKP